MTDARDVIKNSLDFKLDFLGLVNLFGGDIALSAIHYSVLERPRIFWSAYLSPGSCVVATKLLKRTDNIFATSLSPGPRDECRDIAGLLEVGRYSYVGLLSGTRTKVANAIGEAVLNTAQKRTAVKVQTEDPSRATRVNLINVSLDPHEKEGKILSCDELPRWYDTIFTLITLGIFGFTVWLGGNGIGASIIIFGAITNALLTYAACASGCTYMRGKPFHGSPEGNAIVTKELSPNQLWVVTGKEDAIQRLLQRPLVVELDRYWSTVNILAGLIAYAYTAFSIVAFPLVDTTQQLIIGFLYLLGLFANISYARRDGDVLLSKIAEKDMGLNYKDALEFPNRTSAVAYCVLCCKGDTANLNDILPNNTPVWVQWRRLVSRMAKPEILLLDIDKTSQTLNQWQDENPEIREVKENPQYKALWNRLINDLLLAKKAYLKSHNHLSVTLP